MPSNDPEPFVGEPVYLDLFDDGIPAGNIFVDPGTVGPDLQLVDTLRFQMLVALMFGRKIVVPDAWIWSPTFLHVASEVLGGFAEASTVPMRSAIGGLRQPVPSPFLLALSETSSAPAMQRLTQALRWRIETGRRIMFSPTLAADNGKEAALRRSVAQALPGTADPLATQASVPDQLFRILADIDGRQVAARFADAIRRIYGFLDRPAWADDPFRPLAPQSYRAALAREVTRVRDVVLDPQIVGIASEGDLDAFKRFFRSVEGSDPAAIMALWSRLSSLDESAADKQGIEAFGRVVLNRAYAESLGATRLGAVSFEAYCRSQVRPTDVGLLHEVLGRTVPSADPYALQRQVPDFIAIAKERRYDLFDRYERDEWTSVWRAVASLLTNVTWLRQRDAMLGRLRALPESELLSGDPWTGVFDEITAALEQRVNIGVDGANATATLRVVRSTLGGLERLAGLASQDPGTQLSIWGVRALLEHAAGSALRHAQTLPLKAERLRRRLPQSIDPSLMRSMLLTAGL